MLKPKSGLLTREEIEVVVLVAAGMEPAEIEERLGIGRMTVRRRIVSAARRIEYAGCPKPAPSVRRPGAIGERLMWRIARRVKQIRLDRGISQAALALDADIDTRQYREFEHERRGIGIEAAAALAWALGMTLGDLVDEC